MPTYSAHEVQSLAIPAADISDLRVADADGVIQHGSNTGCRSPGELEMTRSTSDVAVCCSSDSVRSVVRLEVVGALAQFV